MGYRKCTLWNLAYIFVSDDIVGRYSRDDKLRASIWLLVKLLCVPIIRGPCPKHHEGLFLKTTRTCVCLYLFVQLVSGAALTAGLVYLTHVQARAMRSIQNTQSCKQLCHLQPLRTAGGGGCVGPSCQPVTICVHAFVGQTLCRTSLKLAPVHDISRRILVQPTALQ